LRSHLLLLVHQVVGNANVGSVVVDLRLLIYIQLGHITVHDLVPGLSYGLCSLIVTFTGKLGRLLNSVDAENLEIRILLQILLVCRNLEELGDDTDLARPIKSCVVELGLEG
jgi:hypothetical protein